MEVFGPSPASGLRFLVGWAGGGEGHGAAAEDLLLLLPRIYCACAAEELPL